MSRLRAFLLLLTSSAAACRSSFSRTSIRPGRALVFLLLLSTVMHARALDLIAGRQMETLGRGLVALTQEDGATFLSWRLLGTDPRTLAFDVYRRTADAQPVKLNATPLTGATVFVDRSSRLDEAYEYFVHPLLDGKKGPASRAFKVEAGRKAKPYISIPLQTLPGYLPNDASVGDLDGDGEYEIVLHQAGRGHDNSQSGTTDPPLLEAYKLDGTFLWRINLGKNIREGAHYTQFMVYDLDGDGWAEVACKTADGTLDGRGKVIGDPNADWRGKSGRTEGKILDGPEFLTVFDGQTGAALATTNYLPPRGVISEWGDDYGNRVDRFLACVAYLDGKRPSLVMCRGYYTRAVLVAWDWRDGQLQRRWTFDTDDGTPGNREYRGQGNHNISVADVDGDGRDEIIYGAAVIDDDGSGLYSTGLGHGDALHVSDLDPTRPGLEVLTIQEKFSEAGLSFRNARTGEIYWKLPSTEKGRDGEGPARGAAIDIDPRYPGNECWAFGAGLTGLYSAGGERLSDARPRSCNLAIWWDGDLLRELLNGVTITKWNWEKGDESLLLDGAAFDCAANNGSKANPCLSADILGDWREELLARTRDGKELRLFISTIATTRRLTTLMHDPVYRLGIAWQNVAYNQPPHTGFYFFGSGCK